MADTQYTKEIYIVGAGGLGRELAGWIDTTELKNQFHVKGFLDDNSGLFDKYGPGYPYKIKGGITEEELANAKHVLVAVAISELKDRIYNWREKSNSFTIENLIYPNAVLGANCQLGEGAILSPNSLVSSDAVMEKGGFINCGSQIGHDVKIGKYANIMAGVNIGGEATIGDNVFIGTGAVILPRIKIADNVKIGSGAVVLKSVKQAGTYFGNPAKRIF